MGRHTIRHCNFCTHNKIVYQYFYFALIANKQYNVVLIYPLFHNVGKCLFKRCDNIGVACARNQHSFLKDHHPSAICSTILIRDCNNEVFDFLEKSYRICVFKIDISRNLKYSFLYHCNVFCMMGRSHNGFIDVYSTYIFIIFQNTIWFRYNFFSFGFTII